MLTKVFRGMQKLFMMTVMISAMVVMVQYVLSRRMVLDCNDKRMDIGAMVMATKTEMMQNGSPLLSSAVQVTTPLPVVQVSVKGIQSMPSEKLDIPASKAAVFKTEVSSQQVVLKRPPRGATPIAAMKRNVIEMSQAIHHEIDNRRKRNFDEAWNSTEEITLSPTSSPSIQPLSETRRGNLRGYNPSQQKIEGSTTLSTGQASVRVAAQYPRSGYYKVESASNILNSSIEKQFTNAEHSMWEVPAYYVNLDRAVHRRKWTESLLTKLQFKFKRVRAINTEEIFRLSVNINVIESGLFLPVSMGEQACLLSHLFAIWQAANDDLDENGSIRPGTSPYALIIEDDIDVQLNFDIQKLVASKPNFAILQLATSNIFQISNMWEAYSADQGNSPDLWQKYHFQEGFWSTQAYVINKAVVRPIINQIITRTPAGSLEFTIIKPNVPECNAYISSCLLPFRLVADLYLYSTFSPTYVSRIPFINSALVGHTSHLRQGNSTANVALITDAIELVKDRHRKEPFLPKIFIL